MTFLNFTFQEASPLISYSDGGWVEGSSSNDTFSASYNGSFRVSFTAGATASFSFVGTAVSIFGATRPNHGNYTVTVDQQPKFTGVGSTSDNQFNKSLWNADNLGYTQHTVTLTNVPAATGNFLDIDYVSIERQIGQDGDNIFQQTLDDTSPSISFSGSWESTTGSSSALQGTLHSTEVANSQVVVPFRGCCVEIYGQYANAPYTVVLDNQPPLDFQGLDVDLTPNFQHPQTLLYLVDGLSEDSNHTVTLTNANTNENRPFMFDYAVISSIHEFNSTGAPLDNSTPGRSSNPNKTSSRGAIVGGIIGGLAVLALLGIGVLLLIRGRRRRRSRNEFALDLMDEETEPKPYVLPTNRTSGDVPHEQDPFQDRALPPLPHSAPPSKFRQQMARPSYYQHNESSPEVAQSSAPGQSATSGPSSYGRAASTTSETSARSGTLASRTASASRRDTKSRLALSHQVAGESSGAAAVQEEDAGVVLDPEDAPGSRTLPPAYNPEWHREQP